ncbi:MAG: ABC transporter ATP-binding protein [Pseudomonadota bacterium]
MNHNRPDVHENKYPLIAFKGLGKTYGQGQSEVTALRGVDLDIVEGDFVAVMGPSGSGKSTAMNIIGCLDIPSAGNYLFKGVDVGSLTRNQRALLRRRYLGFVFQGFNLLSRTSALENTELPLVYRGVPAGERRTRGLQTLETVGLKGWASHTPSELSGGQQQRVAIARALISEPEVLLADEPTGNLDSARSREIMELLTELNRNRGLTVVMVTHEPDMAVYAKRVIRFFDGRVDSDQENGRAN